MNISGCSCGFFPCVCANGVEDAMDFVDTAYDADQVGHAKTNAAKLRLLFEADATSPCMSCMMLPCICPDDDELVVQCSDKAIPSVLDPTPEAIDEETDEYGRVRLGTSATINHEKIKEDIWIAKEIKPLLKPHQVEGVQFLYSHVAAGRGCILADYMGLGKTLQVITVVYSFMVDEIDARKQRSKDPSLRTTDCKERVREDVEPLASVLVLCPAICLPNWDAEFKKWLNAESRTRCPVLLFDSSTTKGGRMRLLRHWKNTGGVLLMGYEMFRGLLNPTTMPTSCAPERETSIQVCSHLASATMEFTCASAQEAAKVQRAAREFRQLLSSPGADLVIMDEGHRMKDPTSLLCQSVAQIQTPRRLILTGYPVQNSLSEYWCMVNFAREKFLGSYEDFRAKYERPILEGDSARSDELIERLRAVVLRRGKALLRSQLPPKMEWILFCKLSPVQHRLYCAFLEFHKNGRATGGAAADLMTAYATLLQVMNHPDVIYSKMCPSEQEQSKLVLEEDEDNDALSSLDTSSDWAWESEERLLEKRHVAAAQRRRKRQKLTDTQKSNDWARSVILGPSEQANTPSVSGYQPQVLENSGKMAVLLRIVEESFASGDKVVVFSQSVPTLKVISDFLRASAFSPSRAVDDAAKQRKRLKNCDLNRRKNASRSSRDPAGILSKHRTQARTSGSKACKTTSALSVSPNEWFLQIDGSTNGVKRMEYIQRFSSKYSFVKLLLVSTRAGAEGINLHAANRLVLFDVSWNPSNDHQSMCRSHRIGQGKTVHVYRLVSTGTMERMIYEQQMKKVDLSTSVVDSHESVQSIKRAEDANKELFPNGAILNPVPYSGFLQPPIEANDKLAVDDDIIRDDEVLNSCVKQLGKWLVGVRPVHEPVYDKTDSKSTWQNKGNVNN